MEGTKLAHYEVISRLGAGGMGEVWLARDTKLEREVALKFLHPALGLDEEGEERLLREARAASSLQHPGILTVHAIENVEGRSFVVMERLRGAAIDEAAKGLDVRGVVALVEEVADALGAAHAGGIVHRDIKPSNLFVNERGKAVVMDFGLARVQDGQQITRSGSTVGTLGYTAPEQLRSQEVGPSADVFSLGVVLYELLGRTRAFDRGQGMAGVIHDVLERDLPPLDDVDENLQAILRRALGKEPGARFSTGAEMQAALRGYLQEGEATAVGAGVAVDGGSATDTRRDSPALGLIAPLLLGTLWLGAIGFAGVWLFRSCGSSESTPEKSQKVDLKAEATAGHAARAWTQRMLNLLTDRAGSPSLSSNGERVAFVSEDASGVPQVFIAEIDDPAPRQLTDFSEGASSPRWSPEGSWLLVSRGAESGGLVKKLPSAYSFPVFGGEPRQLLKSAKNMSFGSGGREVIFESGAKILVFDETTKETRELPIFGETAGADALFDRYPALSPDGQSYAYVRLLLGPLGVIDVVDRTTGEVRTVIEERSRHSHLAYSEDGSRLLFSSDMGGAVNVWSLDLASGERQRLTTGAGDDTAPMAAAGKVIYENRRDEYQLVLFDPSTGAETVLHRARTTIQGGRFDRTGSRVLFAADTGRSADLFELPLDVGARPRRITKGKDELRLFPRWLGEDKALAYLDSASRVGVVEVSMESGEEVMLLPGWTMQTHPFAEASLDGEWISIFRIGPPPGALVFERGSNPAQARAVAGLAGRFSPDGAWYVFEGYGSTVELLDLGAPASKPVQLASLGKQPLLVASQQGTLDAYWTRTRDPEDLTDLFVLRDVTGASGPAGEPSEVITGMEGVISEFPTLDVAPDGRVVFVRFVELSSEIWLLEPAE